MTLSNKINIHIVLISLVLLGSINWGVVGLFNVDLVKAFSSLFGKNAETSVALFLYLLVAGSALILVFQRDTYLPFLGHAVMPQPMTEYSPSGDIITKVVEKLPANVKVIYWASLPSDKVVNNPYDAYGKYTNQGVTTSDENGKATLKVLKPTAYKVSFKGTLVSHIHYRYWDSAGMASRVYTIKL